MNNEEDWDPQRLGFQETTTPKILGTLGSLRGRVGDIDRYDILEVDYPRLMFWSFAPQKPVGCRS